MINKATINSLLQELDKALADGAEKRTLTIFGSGALILQGISNPERATMDVDVVDPEIDMKLQLLCADVGAKYGLDITWLNSAGFIFSRNFPEGWRNRTTSLYQGQSLTILSLHRKDLIATKFNAYCQRGTKNDRIDLCDLAPTKNELTRAKEWLLALRSNELSETVLDKLVKEVLEFTKEAPRG